MRYLIQGNESKERLEILFSFYWRLEDHYKDALIDHLAIGHPETLAASMNGLSKSNFSRALARLNNIAERIERIKELDWAKFNYKSNQQSKN